LWRQKDFSQTLAWPFVVLGVVLSTVAMAYMRPELSLGILMAFALADMILYVVMRGLAWSVIAVMPGIVASRTWKQHAGVGTGE